MHSKVSRNAFKGYTYQQLVFSFLLAKMDTDRTIERIIPEATDTKDFDDALVIMSDGVSYRIQIKNYSNLSIDDIKVCVDSNSVVIKTCVSFFNPCDNNVFIVNSDFGGFEVAESFLGVDACIIDGILVVPLGEEKVIALVNEMFQQKSRALQVLDYGFKCICSGQFEVSVDTLPPLVTVQMGLQQRTIILRKPLDSVKEGLTYIVGKPGIGKSHYVEELRTVITNRVIYRFWIGPQDPQLINRLRFDFFFSQLGLMVFNSPKAFSNLEIIAGLNNSKKVLIIDGLDHVENYNPKELPKFIDFINLLSEHKVRVIVLSRLMKANPWRDRIELTNWSFEEVSRFIALEYNINDYSTQKKIFSLSKGYPIITRYLAEHYVRFGVLEIDTPVDDINEYYRNLICDVNTKSVLAIFAVNNSFFTFKEIESFSGPMFHVIREFISEYPYLFEVVGNRVALIHDSLNTFLRNIPNYSDWKKIIIPIVSDKLLTGDVEYMARLSSFQVDESLVCELLKKYSDIDVFESLIQSSVDFESIAAFYEQMRFALEFRPGILNIYQYYAFCLIYQSVARDNLSGSVALVYQIVSYINKKCPSDDLIFSSGVFWDIITSINGSTCNNRIIDEDQFEDIIVDETIISESQFYKVLDNKTNPIELLSEIHSTNMPNSILQKHLQDYLVLIWIKGIDSAPFYSELELYVSSGYEGSLFESIRQRFQFHDYYIKTIIESSKRLLHELGCFGEKNDYRNRTISDIIRTNAPSGSFSVEADILSVLRLANYEGRDIDIYNVNYLWCMYHQRKDYSVMTIDTALCVFEKHGLIDAMDSICIINKLMKQSEKGISHLLSSYLNTKGTEFARRLVARKDTLCFILPELRLSDLSPDIISCFPKDIVSDCLFKSFGYYPNSGRISAYYIQSALLSKHKSLVCEFLIKHCLSVEGALSEQEREILDAYNVHYTSHDETSQKNHIPLSDGYIGPEDFEYIKEKNLSIIECAKHTDEWLNCLPYVDMYSLFDIKKVRKQHYSIIHYSLFARIVNNSFIGNWCLTIGNIPEFLHRYEIETDWKRLFVVFLRFLDISSIFYPKRLKC